MKKIVGILIVLVFGNLSFAQTCNEIWQIGISQQQITPGQSVVFSYTGASNSGANLLIDFGDGSTQSYLLGAPPVNFPAHTYATSGIYNVKFTLTGACYQTKSAQIVVNPAACSESLAITGYKVICVNNSTTFEIATPSQPGFNLVEIVWNMGDGNFVTNSFTSLNYIYNQTGMYYRSVAVHLYDPTSDEHCYYLVHLFVPNTTTKYYQFKSYVVYGSADFVIVPANPAPGDNVSFIYTGVNTFTTASSVWLYNFSVGSYSSGFQSNPAPGTVLYTINNIQPGAYCADFSIFLRDFNTTYCPNTSQVCFNVSDVPCDTCNSFRPSPGDRYWISAWVKVDENFQVKSYNPTDQDNALNLNAATITEAFVELEFLGSTVTAQFFPSGEIIDGWQRVVGEFTIPASTNDLVVNLYADDLADTYFDDIRIHPFNSSMKSYVYDGETFWLVSELDDNNYATFYEYDQEGGLIRIKKETARGIVTIQETRSNTIKVNP